VKSIRTIPVDISTTQRAQRRQMRIVGLRAAFPGIGGMTTAIPSTQVTDTSDATTTVQILGPTQTAGSKVMQTDTTRIMIAIPKPPIPTRIVLSPLIWDRMRTMTVVMNPVASRRIRIAVETILTGRYTPTMTAGYPIQRAEGIPMRIVA